MSNHDDHDRDTDPTLWDRPDEDYHAENPVNLREQRLRPRTAADPASMRLRPAPAPPTARPAPSAVSAVSAAPTVPEPLSRAEAEALGEARSRDVLGVAAGVEADPAGWGWRGKANALGARLKPDREEVSHRLAVERIRQPLPGTPVIMVCNPKGGGGTTPATLMLSNIFGRHRHGVVAWDTAETRGTLAARAARADRRMPTTWDVVEHAAGLCSDTVAASAMGQFLLAQPTGDEILAGDQSSRRRQMLGATECAAILAVLRRHRTMVLLDTGNNERGEAFTWALDNATALVIPLTYRRDAAHMVLRALDGIAARGHEHLVASAVVVLAQGSAVNPAARHAVHEALARAEITRLTTVPFDPDLAGGERIVASRLHPATVRAWTRVAAVVADGLAETLTDAHPLLNTGPAPASRPVAQELDPRPRPWAAPEPGTGRAEGRAGLRGVHRAGEVAG
ncbi:MinD/ParA family ATP-binding protein [Nocardia takedensis]|uniref:MinD/ParA family ATP-binding protein n=1 Tax=Nocardia takedensis TaxID=259390 RepID=UPI0002F4641F|nr:hypothetical protein [Nocardia takedensis]